MSTAVSERKGQKNKTMFASKKTNFGPQAEILRRISEEEQLDLD